MAYYLKSQNDSTIKRKVKYRAGRSSSGEFATSPRGMRAEWLILKKKTQEKKPFKCTFSNRPHCTYVSCLHSSEALPGSAARAAEDAGLDGANLPRCSCRRARSSATRATGWQRGQGWHGRHLAVSPIEQVGSTTFVLPRWKRIEKFHSSFFPLSCLSLSVSSLSMGLILQNTILFSHTATNTKSTLDPTLAYRH